MRAVGINAFGSPDSLLLITEAEPVAKDRHVIVAVEAVGIGFVDVMMRSGSYPGVKPGFTPGAEFLGTVIAAGSGANAGLIGKKMFAIVRKGGCAERVAIDADSVTLLPDNVTPAHAVATGINALVATSDCISSI